MASITSSSAINMMHLLQPKGADLYKKRGTRATANELPTVKLPDPIF
jgi:hypothetical protein